MVNERSYSKILFMLLCLYLFTVTVFPRYISFAAIVFELSADRMFLFLLLFAIVVGLISFSRFRKNLKENIGSNKTIAVLVVAMLSLQFLSVFVSAEPSYSAKRFINYSLLVGVPFFGLFSLNEESLNFRLLGRVLMTATSILVLICVFEWIYDKNVFSGFVDQDALNEFQQRQMLDKVRGEGRRIQGSFAHPLALGHFTVTILPILIYFKRFTKWKMVMNVLTISLLGLGLLTKSRTVFLILSTSFIVYGYHYLRFHSHNAAVKALAAIFGVFVMVNVLMFADLTSLQSFFGGRELTQDSNRETQIIMALPLILKSPWLGYGFGMGSQTLGFGTSADNSFGTIDNYFLTVILDSGIIALFIFLFLCYRIIKLYFRLRQESKYIFYGLLFFLINLTTLSIIEVHTYFFFFLALTLVSTGKRFDSSYHRIG